MKWAPSQETEMMQKYTATIIAGAFTVRMLSAFTNILYNVAEALENLVFS